MPAPIKFQDLINLLDGYNRAFMDRDGEAISAYYQVPTLTIRGDGSLHVFTSEAEVRTFFQGVSDTYHGQGVRDGAYRILSWQALGEEKGVLTVEWTMLDAEHAPLRGWNQTYNVILEGNALKFYVSTFH